MVVILGLDTYAPYVLMRLCEVPWAAAAVSSCPMVIPASVQVEVVVVVVGGRVTSGLGESYFGDVDVSVSATPSGLLEEPHSLEC